MTKYFVWLSNQLGTHAQIWHDIPKDGNGKSTVKPVFQHKLSDDEESMTLDELIERFKTEVPRDEVF